MLDWFTQQSQLDNWQELVAFIVAVAVFDLLRMRRERRVMKLAMKEPEIINDPE